MHSSTADQRQEHRTRCDNRKTELLTIDHIAALVCACDLHKVGCPRNGISQGCLMLFSVECLIDGSGVIAGLRAIVDGATGKFIRIPGDFGAGSVDSVGEVVDRWRSGVVEEGLRVN